METYQEYYKPEYYIKDFRPSEETNRRMKDLISRIIQNLKQLQRNSRDDSILANFTSDFDTFTKDFLPNATNASFTLAQLGGIIQKSKRKSKKSKRKTKKSKKRKTKRSKKN
jgi:hypothetical protein